MRRFMTGLCFVAAIGLFSYGIWSLNHTSKRALVLDEILNEKKRQEKREVLRDDQEDPHKEALYQEALDYLEKGQLSAAEKNLQHLLSQNPDDADGYVELALLYQFDKKDLKKAIDSYEKALTLEPQRKGLQAELVKLYKETGLLNEGIQFFKELERSHQSGFEVPLGELYLAAGKKNRAAKAASKAIERERDSPLAWGLRGKVKARLREWEEARASLDRAIGAYEATIRAQLLSDGNVSHLTPNLDEVLFEQVKVLMALKRIDQAAAVLDKLAERIPNDPRVVALMDEIYRAKETSQF